MGIDETGILYIDGGTTRTRAWAAVGDRVVASAEAAAGARDGAREGGTSGLAEAVRRLVLEVETRCRAAAGPPPSLAVAAGMITSPQGLVDVPHVEAPADARDLARAAPCRVLPEIAPLPILFVPGVRTGGSRPATRETIAECDVMRGEEALALGLFRRGHLAGGGVLLSLGSHWKAVHVDAAGRIARSVSTLSGELIESVRSHTILASSLPSEWPFVLPPDWLAAGIEDGRRHGLPRACYEVRLLDQRVASEPADRLAFLVGATVAASEDTLLPVSAGTPPRVALAGPPALTRAWEAVVRGRGGTPLVLDDDERSAAFRAGCRAVLEAVPLAAP
ncbi:MAG TPA: 2-dehydro-3-deoxygalactonokinase [Vicinamibacteria bacterium]|nr:2-dehydro-3-deoxygalactonokinase [Vicinamibacteria bacterium]